MKDDLKKAYEQKLPDHLRDRLLKDAEPLLEENARAAEKPSGLFAWLLRPVPAFTVAAGAAALAITVSVYRKEGTAPSSMPFAYDPAMILDAELLIDLEVLKNLDLLEGRKKRQGWPKKKS